MAAIVIVAHAPLATALQAVAAHTFPECRCKVLALDIVPDMESPALALKGIVATLAEPDVLVMTDALGATPCNAALEVAAGNTGVRVVSGVSVPMLWRALAHADAPLEELAERAMAGARNGVMPAHATPPQNQPRPPLGNDPLDDHDQQ